MGSAYIGSVIARSGNTATIRVYQHHPDYGLDPEFFMDEWGAMAIAGWAFTDGYAVLNFKRTKTDAPYAKLLADGAKTALGESIGSFDNLFDTPASDVEALRVTKVELVRSAYNDENSPERLKAAGYPPDQERFHEVVMKICGILDIHVEAEDDEILAPLVVGVEWEY
jgi:hypothetical protein